MSFPGTSHKVKLGKHLKTGEYHVLKIIKEKVVEGEDIVKELDILIELQHPNIWKLITI